MGCDRDRDDHNHNHNHNHNHDQFRDCVVQVHRLNLWLPNPLSPAPRADAAPEAAAAPAPAKKK